MTAAPNLVVPAPSRAPWRWALLAVTALVAAHLADGWAWRALLDKHFANTDLGRLFRIQGYLPTWILVGSALVLHDWPKRAAEGWRGAWRRGGMVVVSAVAGGLLAEVVKLLVRRERPGDTGEYVFRAWSDRPFSTSGLGMASSHVLVAAAALAILARLFPRAAPVCYLLALGCAYSRVAAGAHFLSDVVGALILGALVAELIWRRFRPGPATPP